MFKPKILFGVNLRRFVVLTLELDLWKHFIFYKTLKLCYLYCTFYITLKEPISWNGLQFQVVKSPEAYFYTDFTKTDGVVFLIDF